jgi:hypothetical protein
MIMKTRYIWLLFGLAFFITLAVIVGQRLSSEAMAVIVGVVAGVGASIPTSLIVVWLATRTAAPRPAAEPPAPRPAANAEPRLVVMAAPPGFDPRQGLLAAPAGYQNYAGYAPALYPMPQAADPRALSPLPPRNFRVIGGTEVVLDGDGEATEAVWH